jgi:hypothetical protein
LIQTSKNDKNEFKFCRAIGNKEQQVYGCEAGFMAGKGKSPSKDRLGGNQGGEQILRQVLRRISRMKWFGIMFMAALLIMAPSYGSAQQPKDKTPATQPQGPEVKGEQTGTAKSFTPAERKAYEKNTAEELDVIQKNIAELRVQATTGAPQKKRLINQVAKDLQFQKIAAGNQLTALEKASETAWGQQKASLDKAMEDLRKAWKANSAYLK